MVNFHMTYEHHWKRVPRLGPVKGFRLDWRFFHANAGGIVGRAAIGAWKLAKAERIAGDRGWEFSWEWDDDLASFGCQDDFCPCQKGRDVEHEYLLVVLRDEEGKVLASCGVTDPGDDYRRVMEAELALEALWEEAKQWGGSTVCLPLHS